MMGLAPDKLAEQTQMKIVKENIVEKPLGDTGSLNVTMGFVKTESQVSGEPSKAVFHDDEGGSLTDFLSRPRLLFSTSISPTDTPTQFPKIDLLAAILYHYPEKLKGKYSAQFDVVLNIEVSADRFHAGRYMLCYLPVFSGYLNTGGTYEVSNHPTWATTHANTLVQCTQLQHVEFDVSVDKSAQLRIPWRYINPYIELASWDYYGRALDSPPGYGFIFLRPYSPLSVGSSEATTSTVSCWVSLENVKFYGTANYQADSEKEAASVGKGPISGPLTTVTKTLAGIADVPYIGHYAKPASWVTEALARAAKHFGFSSPRIESGVTPFVNGPGFYNSVTDVPRPIQTLGSSISNSVSVDPSMGCGKIDEMSFDYLKQIYAYKTGFTWTTTHDINHMLHETAVNPLKPYSKTTITNEFPAATYVLQHHGPMGFISSRFRYWRGSIKYRLKIVKTEFHTGKLLVCWVPFNHLAQPYTSPPTVDSSYYRYRQIIDISRGNEFEFVVPYMSPRPWKSVLDVENGGFLGTPNVPGDARAGDTDSVNGYFTVLVLDQLRAPTTAPQSVRILMEAAAGEDFQLAEPNVNYIYHNAGQYHGPKTVWTAFYQMQPENATISTHKFGGHEPFSHEVSVKTATISSGEMFTSLRRLLKRYTTCFVSPADTNHEYMLMPWTGMGIQQKSSIVVVGNQTLIEDDFSYYGSMFTLFRGSIRYKIACDADTTGAASITRNQIVAYLVDCPSGMRANTHRFDSVQLCPQDSTWVGFDLASPWAQPRAQAAIALSEALEIDIPFYAPDYNYNVQSMYQPEEMAGTVSVPSVNEDVIGTPATAVMTNILCPGNHTLRKRYDRSIGEDASFSYFVSCPPIRDPRTDIVL